jgi:tRNA modification GTPase
MEHDTIAAVASGMTASGIGIIRISGPEAFFILSRIFRPRHMSDVTKYRTHTIHYGRIVESDKEQCFTEPDIKQCFQEEKTVDECLVMVMRAPATYTTEDTVEINTHGGPYVMQRVLELVLKNGARPAQPGEFTKRAFLGGRIDLTEAEAVMDVISAKSEDALRSSMMQLSGSIRSVITKQRQILIEELAYIEAALDDPEHYELNSYGEELLKKLLPVEAKLRQLSDSFGEGRLMREGILTVILGKPNAGKSSLLNAILKEDRAIVTEIEGTTRDILEEQVRLGSLSLRIIDTAGIRDARDKIEQIGIGRSKEYASRADLILAVFDSARALDENDREILSLIKDRQALILLNKSDLPAAVTPEMLKEISGQEDLPILSISAKEQLGLEQIEEEIRSLFFKGKLYLNEEAVITNARHKSTLDAALSSLDLVKESIRQGMPEDFYSIDLMDAYKRLGEIIGEDVDDDLADTIFSKFCMGK